MMVLLSSRGTALQALTVNFEVLTPEVAGRRVTVKITVTDSGGNPYPVLAQEIMAKFDGQTVSPAPEGMFQAIPSLTCPPPHELQCPPDQLNATVFFFDLEKLETFFKTHKDAVWLYTTPSLTQSRRYFLDVEVNDGVASGSRTWSILPSPSWRVPPPSEPLPHTLSWGRRQSPLPLASFSRTLPIEPSPFSQVGFGGLSDNLSLRPSSVALLKPGEETFSFPLVAQAQQWNCRTISLTKICESGSFAPPLQGTWEACDFYLKLDHAPQGVTTFRWRGSGPQDPMGYYGTGFDITNDGHSWGFGISPNLVPFPAFLVTAWSAGCGGVPDFCERMDQLFDARFAGWTFQGCVPGGASLTVSLDPPSVRPLDTGAPNTTTIKVRVEDARGDAVANHPVGIAVTSLTYQTAFLEETGGHKHDGGRPTGTFGSPAAGTGSYNSATKEFTGRTNALGNLWVPYTSSRFGGKDQIRAFSLEESSARDSKELDILVEGLVDLPPSLSLVLTGGTDIHPGPNPDFGHTGPPNVNHYCAPDVKEALEFFGPYWLAYIETQQDLSLPLKINDVSLPKGGLFDVNGTWSPPHSTHRIGRDVDINRNPNDAYGVPASLELELQREVREIWKAFYPDSNLQPYVEVHNNNHFHIYF